jgi:hypothetical protein
MIAQKLYILHNKKIWITNPCTEHSIYIMAGKMLKINKLTNQRNSGAINITTVHSQDCYE